jgi:hypothetical protein
LSTLQGGILKTKIWRGKTEHTYIVGGKSLFTLFYINLNLKIHTSNESCLDVPILNNISWIPIN